MGERIPQEELDAARLRLKRRVVMALVAGMADCGLPIERIAERCGMTAKALDRYVLGLLHGTDSSLNMMSDICLAMDCEMNLRLERIERGVKPPETEAETPDASQSQPAEDAQPSDGGQG